MRAHGESFYGIARRLSQQHRRHFTERSLSADREAELDRMAADSLARQAALEAADSEDFDAFLARYFAGL
jgi:glutamate--cysteine ligase